MRFASRIVGILLALAGLAFLTLFVGLVTFGFGRQSVLSAPDRSGWIGASFSAVLGIGLVLAGRYFLKLNTEELNETDDLDETQDRPPSRFTWYFLAHRGALKIIAQGFVISLLRLGAASFGMDWPGKWATAPLYLVSIGLPVIASRIARGGAANRLEWGRVPERTRPVLRFIWKALGPALWILVLLLGWSQWRHQAFPAVVQAGFIVLFFAWAALFFTYGEVTPRETLGNVVGS